jgi:heme-degrading monooxygenase HmoA
MTEVVFINCFEVAPGREDVFFALWSEMDDYMREQQGFRWRRLHRSLDDDARLRFVNVAGWDTAEQFEAAHGADFRRMQQQQGWREFPALPSLYTVEREDHA